MGAKSFGIDRMASRVLCWICWTMGLCSTSPYRDLTMTIKFDCQQLEGAQFVYTGHRFMTTLVKVASRKMLSIQTRGRKRLFLLAQLL